MSLDALFTPFTVKSLTLRNRIVMAPMTREFSPNGVPTEDVAAYYRRRAEGEVGLIVTEGTGIDRPGSRNFPAIPVFHGEALPAWKRVVDEVHAAGGKIAPQLWHVGAVAHGKERAWIPEPIESPSRVHKMGFRGVEMTEEMIADVIAAFARGAADAQRLGFDAVELHGAHGYLFDQFQWAVTNLRTDRWGGPTITERGRFGVEVVKAVRAALDPVIPLILRLSQWKVQDYDARCIHSPEEMRMWLEPLAEAGVDVFHCSQRRYWQPEFDGSDLNFAGWAKKLTGKPTITVGSVGVTGDLQSWRSGTIAQRASLDELMRRFDRGDFDLVAVGRAVLADPCWAVKMRTGRAEECVAFSKEAEETLY